MRHERELASLAVHNGALVLIGNSTFLFFFTFNVTAITFVTSFSADVMPDFAQELWQELAHVRHCGLPLQMIVDGKILFADNVAEPATWTLPEILSKIEQFAQRSDTTERNWALPPTLNSYERRLAHECAHRCGLESHSEGEGSGRRLIVERRQR